ncbi:Hint domain-containing protein [Acetobacter senegalensis]|uniref:Hint domain-containing protein n=1 Tax=Acetobacter senegalensis TaxID=446692 RepID=UPI00264BD4B9|nr:Hint domain-containing protein [Acetobacter senegalensis]MDN7351429.1 Hint domain-containing protein [Acetobacter senegalensis]
MPVSTSPENTVTITSDTTGRTTTSYPFGDLFQVNPIYSSTRTIKTSNDLTYVITTHNYTVAGNPSGATYDVKITDATGRTLLNQNNINRGINLAGIVQIAASGDVISGSGDSAVLVNLASKGTYVSLPGATGNFIVGVGGLAANTYYIGGTSSISGLANLVTGSTVNVIGGTATLTGTSGSTLVGALNGSTVNIEYGGTLNTGAALASVLEGSTVNFGTGGGTMIINGGGTVINLLASGSLNATTFNNYDPSKDTIELQNTVFPVDHYTIANGGVFGTDSSQKIITLYGNNGQKIAEYAVSPASGVTLANGKYKANDNGNNNPLDISYSDGNTYIGACFLAGSMISTPKGDVAVEDIQIGDEVVTFDWRNDKDVTRSVVWVGKAHVNVRSGLPDDEAGWPVRILKDAIADGVPYKDMLITAEHCLFFRDRFVPVRMLVNGVSIFYDKSITSYDYYHVETEQHSVITADGMLTESYLDTGNRSSFRQEGKVATLRGAVKNCADDAGAPLGVERSFVEPLFRALEWRENSVVGSQTAVDPVETTTDPDLHLITQTGAVIRPMRKTAQHYSFMLPPNTDSVRIISRASRPSDVIGPFVDDRRYMGVAVADVQLQCAKRQFDITAHLQEEKPAGWYDTDWTDCAWTNGDAELPLGNHLTHGKMGILSMTIRAAGPYLLNTADKKTQVLSA